jgi:hypothetical protein
MQRDNKEGIPFNISEDKSNTGKSTYIGETTAMRKTRQILQI